MLQFSENTRHSTCVLNSFTNCKPIQLKIEIERIYHSIYFHGTDAFTRKWSTDIQLKQIINGFLLVLNIAPFWPKTRLGKVAFQNCPSLGRLLPASARWSHQQSWPPRTAANNRSLPEWLRWRCRRRNRGRQSRPEVSIPLLGCRSLRKASIGKSLAW